jgi:hypothetical protein
MDTDMLRHRMHIAERPLQRAARVKRTCTARDLRQIDGLHGAVDGVGCSESYKRPYFHRHLAARQNCGPQLIETVEQKKPRRPSMKRILGPPRRHRVRFAILMDHRARGELAAAD